MVVDFVTCLCHQVVVGGGRWREIGAGHGGERW